MTASVTASSRPTIVEAIAPLALLATLILGSLTLFGLSALSGPVPAAMVVCAFATTIIGVRRGVSWAQIETIASEAVGSVTGALLILLGVGALIGTWTASGTIPTLVYYGMQLLTPGWHYLGSALVCAVVAMCVGSSWTTAGTVGVGLVGIALMLGVSPAITAGAVVSGAYLGDKLSPLSETTVLVSQLGGVNLHEHIRHQAKTSLPAFGLALIGFGLLGAFGPTPKGVDLNSEMYQLSELFWITPINLIPVVLLVLLSLLRFPAAPALIVAALFAGILGGFTQLEVYRSFTGEPNALLATVKGIWSTMATGFTSHTGLAEVDQLLSRGGMSSMLSTIWLIIGAVVFGALLDRLGLLSRLINPLLARARSTGRLFLTVFGCGFGLNLVAGDQYVAVILPSRIFKATFAERGLAAKNLSRLAADCGTVTSPLVPWNSCGAFMAATLGISTVLYAPFALFNIASPLLSVGYGYTGFAVERATPVPSPVDAPTPVPAEEE